MPSTSMQYDAASSETEPTRNAPKSQKLGRGPARSPSSETHETGAVGTSEDAFSDQFDRTPVRELSGSDYTDETSDDDRLRKHERRKATMPPPKQAEYEELEGKRRRLRIKKLQSELNSEEQKQLRLVLWRLDQLEAKYYEAELDELKKRGNDQETYVKRLHSFIEEAQNASGSSSRKKRRRRGRTRPQSSE